MKKLSMILLLALMVGAVMAKPPTKQEKKAHKQAEIAAVLDVIKAGRFIIYEPLHSNLLPGEKLEITRLDILDSKSYVINSINDTDNIYQLGFTMNSKTGKNYIYLLRLYKKTGVIKINDYDLGQNSNIISMYTDVIKLID